MSGEEIQLIVGEMREGFKNVRDDIKTSRQERQTQITAIHNRINDIAQNGCAHRSQHEQTIEQLRQELILQRNKGSNGNGSLFGGITTPKGFKIWGIPAAIVAIGLAWAIAHYGLQLL
jgi:hypothetical protein